MTREIENAAGIPVVQIATIVPIMLTVGTNRIVPGVAIPHPVGNPELGPEVDKAARRAAHARIQGYDYAYRRTDNLRKELSLNYPEGRLQAPPSSTKILIRTKNYLFR